VTAQAQTTLGCPKNAKNTWFAARNYPFKTMTYVICELVVVTYLFWSSMATCSITFSSSLFCTSCKAFVNGLSTCSTVNCWGMNLATAVNVFDTSSSKAEASRLWRGFPRSSSKSRALASSFFTTTIVAIDRWLDPFGRPLFLLFFLLLLIHS